MEGTWYFHSLLVVGSLKECLKAEELRRPQEGDLLLTTQGTSQLPLPPPQSNSSDPQGRSPRTTLSETAGAAIAMDWNRFFPEGSVGDEIMRKLPFSLWESILPHLPILSTTGGSIPLGGAIERIKNVCSQDEDFTSSLQGILLHEWKGNEFDTTFKPLDLFSAMSEGTKNFDNSCVFIYLIWR